MVIRTTRACVNRLVLPPNPGQRSCARPPDVIFYALRAMFRPTLFRSSRPDLRELADEDLMPLVHDGDPRAFEVVFDRHADAAFSLAYRMCGRRGMAQDVVQGISSTEDIAADAERREDARDVRAALRDLPPDQRQVIELAYFGGFSHSQISEMLDVPAGTVKGRMRLGLTKLRVTLSDPLGGAAMTELQP